MTNTTETTGWTGTLRQTSKRVGNVLSKWWAYVGFSMFLAILNLLLGIVTLSYLKSKKEPILFGIVCFGVVIALAHFASLCYLLQRAKDDVSDPTYIDAAYGSGVVLLFVVSGIALSIELPSRCYSGPNEHFKNVGRGVCTSITAMAISSWLAALIMIIAAIMIFFAAREAIEIAKQPPPVFPSAAEAPIMRWLDRNDPFRGTTPYRTSNV